MDASPRIRQATTQIFEALKLLDEEISPDPAISLAAAHLQTAFDLVVDRTTGVISH